MMLLGDFQKGGPPLLLGPEGPAPPKYQNYPVSGHLPQCTDGPCLWPQPDGRSLSWHHEHWLQVCHTVQLSTALGAG